MPAVTGAFSQLIKRQYHKIFFDEYNRHKEEALKVAKVSNHDEHYLEEGQLAGLGPFVETAEGAGVSYDNFQQGNTKQITFDKYTLGFTVTEEAWDDDLTGHLKKAPAELGKSAAYTVELLYWDIFNNGFTTTYYTGVDGEALFEDSHDTIDGSATIDNQSTSALSLSSYETALNYFDDDLVNERGIPIVGRPDLLIVPPALRWTAKEILGSEYKPYTSDNEINPTYGNGVNVMVCHYLTSDTAWFLVDSSLMDVRWIWRKAVSFGNYDDFNTGDTLFKGSFRAKAAFWDYRGVYGSSGA
jgi:phage major head subunit gpT-like protein